jgi:hypothetical protein
LLEAFNFGLHLLDGARVLREGRATAGKKRQNHCPPD